MIGGVASPISIGVADQLCGCTGPIWQSPVLSATYVPKYALRTLKVLLGRSRHELTDHPDRITEVGSGDGQVYEPSDNLSEPRRVAYLPGVGTKLHGSV